MTRTTFAAVLIATLLAALTGCTTGAGPETVTVPVGEPSYTGDDPYEGNGDLACGSDTGAATAALLDPPTSSDARVLVTFRGTSEYWVFIVNVDEFQAVRIGVEDLFGEDALERFEPEDIDELQWEMCAPVDRRGARAQRIYSILASSLKESPENFTLQLCGE